MSELITKVCRVDTVAGAKLCGALGADFIGLHAITSRRDHLTQTRRDSFSRIGDLVRDGELTCKPVLLTKDLDFDLIARLAEASCSVAVQLHDPALDLGYARNLREACLRRGLDQVNFWKVIAPDPDLRDAGEQEQRFRSTVQEWLGSAEGFLFDSSMRGGSGEILPKDLRNAVSRTIAEFCAGKLALVAGGLSAANVALAIKETSAAGGDAQSSLEIKRASADPRSLFKSPRLKNIENVAAFISAVSGRPPEDVLGHYREMRAQQRRVLVSPSELEPNAARMFLAEAALSVVDGIQIDVADGTAGVPADKWLDADQQAATAWDVAPELPIWIHLFSRNLDWQEEQIERVRQVTPHLVGVFVQPGDNAEGTALLCNELRERARLPVIPSVTTRSVLEAEGLSASLKHSSQWQVTAPGSSADNKARRVGEAIWRMRQARAETHVTVDRGVSIPLLREIGADRERLPNGVTIGRGLLNSAIQVGLDTVRNELLHV